ncbi:MAG: mucoidy inhibitor MuiA family protein [Hyphomicrobiaceae bacterium]
MRLLATAARTTFTTAALHLTALTLPAVIAPALVHTAWAAEIAATSKLDAVTVYRSGAQVSRVVTQEIEEGAHTLVIKDLPAEAILGSIRVEGQADGNLQIGAVDAKRVSVLSDDAAAQDRARKDLEDELEKLTDAMDQLRAEIETKETQKTFVTNLAGLPQRPPVAPREGTTINHDWSKLLDLIGTSMADIQSDIIKTRIAMRDLGRKIEDVKKKMALQSPKQEKRTEVRISVEAGGELNADLVIKYQVGNASWRPHYDARLETGSKDKAAGLMLTRRASIQQYTGEVWENVTLALSTSRPSGKSSAPTLRPLTVDFRRPPPKPAVAYGGTRSSLRQAAPRAEADRTVAQAPVARKRKARVKKVISEAGGRLQQTAFQASFAVPGRVTVTNTGEAKRVKLDDQQIKPKLHVRTVPRRNTSAYLYASLEMPRSAPYLAGPVSLFRDGGFVGTGRLPNLAPGADHEMGFGSDPSVIVKYHILGEKRGETGIISSSATDQRNFKIDITNQHQRKIDVVVIDQMPVSLNEDISVDLLGPTSPSKRNYDDKRGLLAWQFTLDAAAKKTVQFGYTISWPADKKISFRYRR